MANLKEMLSKEQKSVQHYHHMYDNEKNGSYIPKAKKERIWTLAQKSYDERIVRLARKRLGQIGRILRDYDDDEIEKIVGTFQRKEAVEDFSVAVSYDEIKEKGYSLSAGQYFDIKIDYVDITEEEFNNRMANYKQTLSEQFKESHRLEEEIMKQLDALQFNENVGSNE